MCVSVCVCKQWPCYAVPLHARLCQDKPEQGQFLLVLGRNRPLCSSVTQLQLLCCGCPAQPCPVLEDRAGHRGTYRTLSLSNLDSGTNSLAAVPTRLRGWQPHLCAHRPDTTVLGVPSPHAALYRGVYSWAFCRASREADGTARWLCPRS